MTGYGVNVTITPPTAFPATLGAGATYNLGVFPFPGKGLTLAANLSQNSTLTIQRYADAAGALPVGAAITATTTGGTAGYVAVNDGLPALYAQVSITNNGGTTATVTGAVLNCQLG